MTDIGTFMVIYALVALFIAVGIITRVVRAIRRGQRPCARPFMSDGQRGWHRPGEFPSSDYQTGGGQTGGHHHSGHHHGGGFDFGSHSGGGHSSGHDMGGGGHHG